MASSSTRRWPTRDTVWRWHFYAGLFAIPFILWLSLTGAVYLWKPQVEAWLDAPYDRLPVAGAAQAPSKIAAAAVAATALPFRGFELPVAEGRAARVIVGMSRAEAVRVYVDPRTLNILHSVPERDRLMNIVFHLHGDLLQGDPGSYLIELAGSWAIVMILSGLFLWWPRGGGLAGIVWPRLGGPSRRRWRDLHAVTGFWVAGLALFMLVSGLPWAKSWSSYLTAVRNVVEGPTGPPDWMSASRHAMHGGMPRPAPVDLFALDRLLPVAAAQKLAAPAMLVPPARPGAPWLARSEAQDRTAQVTVGLDAATARVVDRRDFAGKPLIERIVGVGASMHEGQLYGLANQLLGLFTALCLILVAVSSTVLWWRRRPVGLLGAPPGRPARGLAAGFFILLAVIGILLPLFGVSLLTVLLAERLIVWRSPPVARWLGLAPVPKGQYS